MNDFNYQRRALVLDNRLEEVLSSMKEPTKVAESGLVEFVMRKSIAEEIGALTKVSHDLNTLTAANSMDEIIAQRTTGFDLFLATAKVATDARAEEQHDEATLYGAYAALQKEASAGGEAAKAMKFITADEVRAGIHGARMLRGALVGGAIGGAGGAATGSSEKKDRLKRGLIGAAGGALLGAGAGHLYHGKGELSPEHAKELREALSSGRSHAHEGQRTFVKGKLHEGESAILRESDLGQKVPWYRRERHMDLAKMDPAPAAKTSSFLDNLEKGLISGTHARHVIGAQRALIGGAIGAGTGAVGGAIAGGPDHRLSGAASGAVAGGALGAGAGAAFHGIKGVSAERALSGRKFLEPMGIRTIGNSGDKGREMLAGFEKARGLAPGHAERELMQRAGGFAPHPVPLVPPVPTP